MSHKKEIVRQQIKSGKAGIPAATIPLRVLEDGVLVAVHGEVREGGAGTAVCGIFRFEGERVAASWGRTQSQPEKTASGRTMVDGPTEPGDPSRTAANKELVGNMLREILIGGKFDKITDYYSTRQLAQHNPMIGDGLAGIQAAMSALAQQGITMKYEKCLHLVAEGDFVLAQCEGSFAGKPYSFYDLYRLQDNKIVEHWDVMGEGA